MVRRYTTKGRRELVKQAREVLAESPGITGMDLAVQLGIADSSARKVLAVIDHDLPDPVQLAREHLIKHPRATGREIGELLGLSAASGWRYRDLARCDLRRNPPPGALPKPRHKYRVPSFLPKKGE